MYLRLCVCIYVCIAPFNLYLRLLCLNNRRHYSCNYSISPTEINNKWCVCIAHDFLRRSAPTAIEQRNRCWHTLFRGFQRGYERADCFRCMLFGQEFNVGILFRPSAWIA